MKYLNIISEKYRIATIKPEDLEYGLAMDILKQWGPGKKLSGLTIYHDLNEDYLVINRVHPRYETLKEIVIVFFEADPNKRKEITDNAPEILKDVVRVLNNCVDYRQYKKEMFYVSHSYIPHTPMISCMYKYGAGIYDAYMIGMAAGKRMERAKKKRAAVQ